mgnify:CR=1 FL=1
MLKLIFFLAGSYIALAISWAIVMIVYIKADNFNTYFVPNIALPRLADFSAHWWTLFIYGIFHFPNSFMEMLSNMLWLYCFGSVLQMLVGFLFILAATTRWFRCLPPTRYGATCRAHGNMCSSSYHFAQV